MESKYLMAQETIQLLQKELESLKRTQAGLVTFSSRLSAFFPVGLLQNLWQKGTLTRI